MSVTGKTVGQAKIALVFGGADNRKAILSKVTVRARVRQKSRSLAFTGPVKFAESTAMHITSVILPIVDCVLESLAVTPKTFEVSVMNIGATACHDLAIEVSGLSGDLPVTLAMLSAALRMPIRDDFVATGHIASTRGDIVAVKGIPAKLAAAIAEKSIKRFIYGRLEEDRSLDVLSPHEKETSITAVMRACNDIDTRSVSGLDELITDVFSEHDTLTASLKNGFFHIPHEASAAGDPVSRTIDLLMGQNEARLWQLLQRDFMTSECDRAVSLLDTYAASFLRRRQYPPGFGGKLLRSMCAMPPVIRRLKLTYPLLDFGRCAQLVRLAGPSDFADVPILFDAVRGKVVGGGGPEPVSHESLETAVSESDPFDTIAAQIDELTLARKFAIPVDSARASYVLASSTVASYDEFIGIVESFFVHLQTYTNAGTPAVPDAECVADRAMALLNETFRSHGGAQAAYAQARDGTEGGIRAVLDAMTEQYKTRLQADHVAVVLEKAVAAMSWPDRIRFTQAAMNRLRPFLPAEIRDEPPERFARQAADIAKAYVRSTSPMLRLLSTM